MKTLFITADPDIALHAEGAGVDVIFIDMETRGKAERQGHLDTHKAAHSLADVAALAPLLSRAELMVRINPPWERTAQEVADAIAAGATRLMLPMFSHAAEVAAFKQAAGTTPVTLLVETAAALARLPVILPLLGAQDRVHFGLNDLSLDMKLGFLFEVLGGRLLDGPAALCREASVAFGFGGVGRIGQPVQRRFDSRRSCLGRGQEHQALFPEHQHEYFFPRVQSIVRLRAPQVGA